MDNSKPKNPVRIFAIASFLNDMGSDIIYPIWPLFLSSFAGINMTIIGLIDGIGDAIVSISQAVSGYVSDKIKRRKIFIWLGYLFGSLSRIGYALSASWQYIIPFRILDRSGKIRGAPRDAIIAEISMNEKGRNFGILRAFDNLGAVMGILLSILLFGYLGYKKLFLLAAVPSVIAVLLIIGFIKEKKPKLKLHEGISLKNLSTNFKLFLISSSFFALGSFSYSFLLLYAKDFGFKIGFIPILYLIFTVVAFMFSYYFGKLSDKIGRKSVIFISYGFWILLCFIFIFLKSFALILIGFVLYGLHKAAIEPVQKAFVSELAPKEFVASTLGGFQMVIGIIALPASLFAGLLWSKINVYAPFYFSMFLTLAAIFILIFVREN